MSVHTALSPCVLACAAVESHKPQGPGLHMYNLTQARPSHPSDRCELCKLYGAGNMVCPVAGVARTWRVSWSARDMPGPLPSHASIFQSVSTLNTRAFEVNHHPTCTPDRKTRARAYVRVCVSPRV
eukprot:357586-Chlamydomonas_euryale.AAC.5